MATFTIQDRSFSCPVELAVSVIEGKWKVLILWNLRDATLRYSEIRDAVGDISDKMLAQQLQGLEADGLLHRTVYPVVPPKTEYELTEEGRRLLPVLTAMQQWGLTYKEAEDEIACRE
jgi:DNA-binding HxlR family transcriptional regulator